MFLPWEWTMVLSIVFTPYVSLVCSNLYSIGLPGLRAVVEANAGLQEDLCLPVCQHQVQAIERHARWDNRAISSAPNVQPSTANWQTTLEPPTVFGRGSNAIFHQVMREPEKCCKSISVGKWLILHWNIPDLLKIFDKVLRNTENRKKQVWERILGLRLGWGPMSL